MAERVDRGTVVKRQIAANGISRVVRCGARVVAASYDGSVALGEPADLRVVQRLRAMQQRLVAVPFLPAEEETCDAKALEDAVGV